MSLWRSSPGGLTATGWKRLVAVTLGFCLGPAVLGGAGLGLVHLLGPGRLGDGFLHGGTLATFLVLTPLVSWPFWAALGVAAGFLMQRGAYGALTAVVLGALLGGATGLTAGVAPVLAALGAILATFHRFLLAVLRPLAF